MYVAVPLPYIDLHFIDYAVLALLLSVLYGCTSVELLLSALAKTELPQPNEINLRKAATWAVVGILLTLIAGVLAESHGASQSAGAAQSPVLAPSAGSASSVSAAAVVSPLTGPSIGDLLFEYGGLLVPLLAIMRWGAFHLTGSRVVNFELVAKELNAGYKIEILHYLRGLPTQRATREEILLACSKRLVTSRVIDMLRASFSVSRYLVRMDLDDIANNLVFNADRLDQLLKELTREKKIQYDRENDAFLLEGAPPLPPPAPK